MGNHTNLSELIDRYGDVLAQFFNHISDMVFLMSVEGENRFRYVKMNPAAMRVAGLDERAYGKLIEEVYDGEKAQLLISKYQEAVLAGKPTSYIDHGSIIGESILTPIFNTEGVCTHVFSVTRDITERKRLEDQLHHLAYHDMLTDLPNRRLLQELLHAAIESARKQDDLLAVLYLDFDSFKSINDNLGHDMGDQFLQSIAKRLRNCVRENDILARLGGDEFIVVLTQIQSIREVTKIAQRIVQNLEQPWSFDNQPFTTTVSVGISLFPHDGETADLLLKQADTALYRAKKEGKNRYTWYDPSSIETE